MVRLCDAIMGMGKTESAIRYMNEHPDKRYIYITPYLDEAKRIKCGCPDLHFYEPTRASAETHHSKTMDTMAQIQNGRNIASTHEAFGYYTPDMIELIRESHYTLMIDESVNVLEKERVSPGDVEVLVAGGYVEYDGQLYTTTGKEYPGTHEKQFMRRLRSRDFYHVDGDQYQEDYYFWALPAEFVLAFDDVTIMTYMFAGHDMYLFMKMNGINYANIGVKRDETGFQFCDQPGLMPEHAGRLKDMIHIFDNDKLNSIGDDKHALSMSWFQNRDNVNSLSKNMVQYFRYHMKNFGASERLYGTYKDYIPPLGRCGFTNAGLIFNSRATNEYADRHVLVYAANVFYDGGRRKFFKDRGITVNEDLYALSTMIQWIWRSAIRKGEEIWIYIPSRRMRELLQGWLDSLASEGTGCAAPTERGCDANEEGVQRLFVG